MMDSPQKPEHPFSQMFSVRKLIGKGSVSEVFECEHRESKKRYAAKFELTSKRGPQQLERELALYRKMSGFNEVCKVHWTGEYDEYKVAVMDLLDKSLEDRMTDCPNGLSLKTVLLLADQMIRRVELVHNMGYIHRDIKPDNFAPGLDSAASTLYLIDYGIAKRYVDNHGNHIPFRERCPAAGTLRYISINGHLGLEQSRRDDMESIGYVLLYLLRGSLPWQGIQAASPREKCMKVAEKKIQTAPDTLFAGYPPEFAQYMKQVRKLKFEEEPDYAGYRKLFADLFRRRGFVYDGNYDWMKKKGIAQTKSQTAIQHLLIDAQHVKARCAPIDIKRCPIMRPNVVDLRPVLSRAGRCM